MKILATVFVLCCAGLAANAKVARINNLGETAAPGEFPHQVSIRANDQHFCGGALISKTHVLTAAHCVVDLVQRQVPLAMFKIEVGATQLDTGMKYDVKRISYHKDYSKSVTALSPNDIAVITLTSPVQTSSTVQPISLPSPNAPVPVGSQVIVTGFGTSTVDGPVSQILKKLDTVIVSSEECQPNYYFPLVDSQICAGREAPYNTCKGDSGGPLVDATKSTIVGVVSGGTGRCGSGAPDIYTRVSDFIDYVKAEMNGNASEHPALDESNQAQSSDPFGQIDLSSVWFQPQFGQPGAPQGWLQLQPGQPSIQPGWSLQGIPQNPWGPDELAQGGQLLWG